MTDSTVAVRLDPKEYFWLCDLADRCNLSKSQILRIIIANARIGKAMPQDWVVKHD